jgi:hypothetical protein
LYSVAVAVRAAFVDCGVAVWFASSSLRLFIILYLQYYFKIEKAGRNNNQA